MRRFKGWFSGLTHVGKVSFLSVLALGGLIAVSATPPAEPRGVTTDTSTRIQRSVEPEPVVTKKVETETETIPFEKQTIEDDNLAKGSTHVRVAGVEGVRTITHTITLTDGIETDRVSSETVTVKPITQVTAIGTYVAPPKPESVPYVSSGIVKKSRSSICHAPGTTYYSRTKHFTSYDNLQACLDSGGRMPKR